MPNAKKIKVLVTGKLHPQAIDSFEKHPSIDLWNKPDISRKEIESYISEAEVLITRSETTIDPSLLALADKLKVIGRAAVGVGNIDLEEATKRGIIVINCPGKNTNSAAELTLGLLLSMFRNIPQAHQKVKSSGWDRHLFQGNELKEKKIGIVGLGNVGHRVAKFAKGFDMKVYAFDPYISDKKFEQYQAIKVDSLEELAKKVDILSLHVPLNEETKYLVDQKILSEMKPNAYLVNAARGGVVHESDLLAALDSGQIAGAAIDTWQGEPKIDQKLSLHKKVWVSPHIGATTIEAQKSIGKTIFEQVMRALEGDVVDYPVNMPNISVIPNQEIKKYTVLAEKLGKLARQVASFNIKKIHIKYRGKITKTDNSLICLGFLKGYLSGIVEGYVSFVNVQENAERLGIVVEESTDPSFTGYESAIKIELSQSHQEKLIVGGTVFQEKFLRVSLIDGFYFEVEPNGSFLIIKNNDKPGVIGDIGTFLAKENINIGSFDLSRNKAGGEAMAVIRVDQSISSSSLDKISAIQNIRKAHFVEL